MAQFARIKLTSTNLPELEKVANDIREIADKTGVKVRGPQPLPTKKLKITTRKAPTGEGSHTFDHWQLRVHRRILDVQPDDRTMRQITKLRIPEDVKVELILHPSPGPLPSRWFGANPARGSDRAHSPVPPSPSPRRDS